MNLQQIKNIIKEQISQLRYQKQSYNEEKTGGKISCKCNNHGNGCWGTFNGTTADCSCCSKYTLGLPEGHSKQTLNEGVVCWGTMNGVFGMNMPGGDTCMECGGCSLNATSCNGTNMFNTEAECNAHYTNLGPTFSPTGPNAPMAYQGKRR